MTLILEKIAYYTKIHHPTALRRRSYSFVKTVIVYMLLTGFAFVFLFPFLHMFITAIKHPIDLLNVNTKWIVKNPDWRNFRLAFDELDYLNGLKNSIIVVVFSGIGQVLSCSFVAYGLARYKFKGKKVIFSLIILSIIIPPQIFIIPLFVQYSKLGFIDTFLPIILPGFFSLGLKGSLFTFIFLQFFKGLPKELEEAARIDGCNPVAIYWKIILPISTSAILVTAILSLVWHWNDYFEPSIFLQTPSMGVLSMSIKRVMEGRHFYVSSDGNMVNPLGMAGATLIILPVFTIFLFLQKKFMAGVERTGLAN